MSQVIVSPAGLAPPGPLQVSARRRRHRRCRVAHSFRQGSKPHRLACRSRHQLRRSRLSGSTVGTRWLLAAVSPGCTSWSDEGTVGTAEQARLRRPRTRLGRRCTWPPGFGPSLPREETKDRATRSRVRPCRRIMQSPFRGKPPVPARTTTRTRSTRVLGLLAPSCRLRRHPHLCHRRPPAVIARDLGLLLFGRDNDGASVRAAARGQVLRYCCSWRSPFTGEHRLLVGGARLIARGRSKGRSPSRR